jgi:hypothetical protein
MQKRLLALVLFSATQACLLTPNQDDVLCGANASVLFSGYSTVANQTVYIQAARARTGPFTTLGTAVTGSSPVNYGGMQLYYFSTTRTITRWESTDATLRTYVRAVIYPTGSFQSPMYLTTFDAQPPTGSTPTNCIAARVNSGDTLMEATNYCASDDSPIAELFAPAQSTCPCSNTSYTGTLVIDDANDAASFVCLQSLTGSLTIADSAPETVPLPSLTSISGSATLHYERPLTGQQYKRRAINLPSLTSVGGDLTIFGRDTISVSATPAGLHAVTFVGGDLTISLYGVHPNLLSSLAHLDGDLTIQGWTPQGNLDINASNTLANLGSVDGDVRVQYFYATNGVLNSLTTIGGSLHLESLNMAAVPSLQALESVGANLHFVDTFVGGAFPAIDTIGGELGYLGYPSNTNVSFNAVQGALASSLRIENNAALTTLGTGVQIGAGNIEIHGNPQLSQCEVDGFLSEQLAGGWTGSAFVTGTIACP